MAIPLQKYSTILENKSCNHPSRIDLCFRRAIRGHVWVMACVHSVLLLEPCILFLAPIDGGTVNTSLIILFHHRC